MNLRLDKTAIRNILTIRYDPNEESSIEPITWKDCRQQKSDPDGYITEKLLESSVKNKLKNLKGPFAVSLSSGIDSSLCLALLRKIYPHEKIVAICGVFEESNDESKIAEKIARKFNADFHTIKMQSIFSTMPEIISITNKPKWNTYTHIIAKEAKKFSKTIITGDGADEIFGGYSFRYSKFMNLLQHGDNWKIKVINYLECHNRDWVPDQEQLFGSAIKFDWEKIHNYFRQFFTNTLHPLKQVMLADFNGKLLHDFIPSGNSVTRYYGLKGIQFFLDHNVMKHGLSLSPSELYDIKTQKGKLTLRKITKRLGIDHIEEKKGFSPSLWLDWKQYGKKICESYILEKDSYVFRKRLINYNWVLRSFEKVEHDGDIRYLNRLISILALEIWCRVFITKELKKNKKLT